MIVHEVSIHTHGFVKLLDVMGDDEAVVNAARISHNKKSAADDRALIRYLMRHRHTSPFEMCELKFHIRLPIFVARQWIRHRTASVNEVSGRYSVLPSCWYAPDDVYLQSNTNKQGSSGHADAELRYDFIQACNAADGTFTTYNELCDRGLSREQARINLPLSTYTEWYWKIDLHNLFHFLKLRTDIHAQQEIRDYAMVIEQMVAKLFPLSYQAWVDYVKEAVVLSKQEVALLKLFVGTERCNVNIAVLDTTASQLNTREIEAFKSTWSI